MQFINTDKGKYFFEDDNKHRHDIMLLKLPTYFNKGSHINISLPGTVTAAGVTCKSPTANGQPYTIMGWSYTAYDAATKKCELDPDFNKSEYFIL